MTTFYEFGISPELIRATASMGFEEATKIQELAIPLALTNRDIIGQAQTGTGKTAAFGLPMLEKCRPENRAIQGLVITPTRELAVQVAEELNTLGQFKNIRALPIYGGQDIERQIRALKQTAGNCRHSGTSDGPYATQADPAATVGCGGA
jgi:ATP-dependent RNA helicase DeaD